MLTGAAPSGERVAVDDPLRTRARALRALSEVLREKVTRSQYKATQRCQDSARILVESRRLRGEVLRAWLPRDPNCGAVARRLVDKHLISATDKQLVDAKTVASELANNAFLHGDGRIELRISERRGRVRVEVINEGQRAVVSAGQRDRAHGLDVVEALALAWGAHAGSTHVWAELPAGGPSVVLATRQRSR